MYTQQNYLSAIREKIYFQTNKIQDSLSHTTGKFNGGTRVDKKESQMEE